MEYRLIYTSESGQFFSDRELLHLLEKSRTFNRAHNLTGLLLFRANTFLQIIEGLEQNVNVLFNKIKEDPRHGNIEILKSRKVKAKIFPHWSMASKDTLEIDFSLKKNLEKYLVELGNRRANDARIVKRVVSEFYFNK